MRRILLRRSFAATLLVSVACFLVAESLQGDPPKSAKQQAPAVQVPIGMLSTADWLKYPTTPLQAGEIDSLIAKEWEKAGIKPAPVATDEQFLRRLTIDLAGRLPTASELSQFMADKNADKRAKVINKLLDSEDYARHWARYWREVIASRAANPFANFFTRAFETWLAQQLKENKSWAQITSTILTATGPMRNDDAAANAPGYFLATKTGADGVTERAAETSRIFLGIQIQCAQCHDHPSDVWKRQQFHEFAAYFARLRDRVIFEEKRIVGVNLTAVQFGEHQMVDAKNPQQAMTIQPRFLDEKGPGPAGKVGAVAKGKGKGFGGVGKGGGGGGGAGDVQRRKSLTDAVTSKNNPWFAGAFVNRMWGELIGQSFYQPVDDMGPKKDTVMPVVLARVSASFRGSDYDIKGLFREILNSQAYQRQIRPTEPGTDHLLFASNNPRRMSADALWQTLVATLGPLGGPGGGGKGPKGGGFGGPGGGFGLEGTFKREFQFDPSVKPDEVEGSISQALILMNNPTINQKISAKGSTMLARILEDNTENDNALKAVYQRTLGRRPSQRELDRCREHLRTITNRGEAFEDILWALINSTEFQMRR